MVGFCTDFVRIFRPGAKAPGRVADREKGVRRLLVEPGTWRALSFIGLPSARLVKGRSAGAQRRLINTICIAHISAKLKGQSAEFLKHLGTRLHDANTEANGCRAASCAGKKHILLGAN
jgi:uncharacterized membrane-anchored protein